MIKRSLTLSLCMLSFLPIISQANWDGAYAGLLGGIDYPVDIHKNAASFTFNKPGYAIGGAVGYRSGLFTYSGEILYNNIKYRKITALPGFSGKTQATTAMATIYLNIPTPTRVEPYLGGGVGYILLFNDANIDGKIKSISDLTFGFQATGGVAVHISHHWMATTDYRFYVSRTLGTYGGKRFQNHMLNFGLAYRI